MPRRCRATGALVFSAALLWGCGSKGPVAPAPPASSFQDSVYQRLQALQQQLAPQDGIRHGVVATERDAAGAWRVIVLANGTSRLALNTAVAGAHACWLGAELPGILFDDGPTGSAIHGLATDGKFSSFPVEIVRAAGVVHTPMVSRDGKVFAYVLQEAGNDTCYAVIHDGRSVRRYMLQRRSWNTQISMSERGEALFFTVAYAGLYGLWLDADGPQRVLYDGQYRAALTADRGTLFYSQTHGAAVTLNSGLLDAQHQMTIIRWLAGCATCTTRQYDDVALGPAGEIYCVQCTDGTRRLRNQTMGQVLTAGSENYYWPSVQ